VRPSQKRKVAVKRILAKRRVVLVKRVLRIVGQRIVVSVQLSLLSRSTSPLYCSVYLNTTIDWC